MEKKIDARGMQCPLPVIEAKKAIDNMTENGWIIITVDNEIAVQNVLKLAKQKEIQAEYDVINKDEYKVILQIKETAKQSTNMQKEQSHYKKNSSAVLQESNSESDNETKKKTVVTISSNAMGSGDEAFGKTLMKGFLFALLKQDTLPDIILFYNSGAFIVTEGSDSLEDLKCLEDEGVEIMTCGACLDHYEIKDKVQVGSITNMYSIAEVMLNAGLIIKP
jgi:selenium metabolism protein YedF